MARIGVLALLLAALLGACSPPPSSIVIPPSAGVSAPPSATASPRPPNATFPSEVAGLPVITVARADELLRSGRLDGEVVAVGGYFDQMTPSCPYPGRYIGPLEAWCQFVAFTDSRATAKLCQPEGTNGMSCRQPSETSLVPFFMSETSGDAWSWVTGGATGEPAAMVLIGHAGDARQWLCTAATQAQCASAFVVDRIAWAEGNDVPPAARQVGDQQTGEAITPAMTLAQVEAAIGLGDEMLTGAAIRAGDIASIDPRWNRGGDGIVWLVRSLAKAAEPGAGDSRSATVWLVDDATGHVIDSHPLKLAPDYRPARLWQMSTVHGVECCAGDVLAYYRVASGDGRVLYEGTVPGGSSGGTGFTTYGGSYRSGPLVLPAGDYAITAWIAPYFSGLTGAPRGECSTKVTLRPLDDVALNADFPPDKACTFGPAPSPTIGS